MANNVVTQQPISQPPVAQDFSGYPPGMEYLANVNVLLVKQLVELLEVLSGISTTNRYEVMDGEGWRMYIAAEITAEAATACFQSGRVFTILILNNSGVPVMKLDRRYGFLVSCWCYVSELYISTPADIVIGKVTEERFSYAVPKFTVWDSTDRAVFRIEGPCTMCIGGSAQFKICDLSGNVIGVIQKYWGGFAKESVSAADTFGVTFPVELDPQLKALLLGAVFLIDFMFFEVVPTQQQRDDRGYGQFRGVRIGIR